MRRILLLLATLAVGFVPVVGAGAAINLNAEHETSGADDCRFSSWYVVTQPLQKSGALTSVVDGRCSVAHQIELDLTVTEGESDVTAAAGPANPVLGVSEAQPTGVVKSSDRTVVDQPGAQLISVLPSPPAGAVYTVNAIMKFSDPCAALGCSPPPTPPAAPDAPGSAAPLSNQGMTCTAQHDGVFDVDCEWQFTVVGRAL